jgi:hypothetical protein
MLKYELAPEMVDILLVALNKVQFAGRNAAKLVADTDAALRPQFEAYLATLPKPEVVEEKK